MIISDKQHEANCRNAQHSTGPNTPEGKEAVRLNALTYGLRAGQLLLPGEDPELYKQLWARLEADWKPQTYTERLDLEQMATSQWLLARMAKTERLIYEADYEIAARLYLLRDVAALRARLERSFRTASQDLKQLQNERQASTSKAAPVLALKPAEPNPVPTSQPSERGAQNAPPAFYEPAPVAADTR